MGRKAKATRGVLRDGLQLLACGKIYVDAEAEVKTFSSRLAPGGDRALTQGLGAVAKSDYEALEGVRYLVRSERPDLMAGPLDLPVNFLVDELFALDVDSEDSMMTFFAKWGVPCVPLFDSRSRCCDTSHLRLGRDLAEAEVLAEKLPFIQAIIKFCRAHARKTDPMGERRHGEPGTRELAYAVNGALSLGECEAGLLNVDDYPLVQAQRRAAAQSEAIRIEEFMFGGRPLGIVSWDEATLALKLLRECVAYAVAADVALGRGMVGGLGTYKDRGVVAKLMVDELRVTPKLLCGSSEGFDYSTIDAFGGIQYPDSAVMNYLSACMRSGAPLEVSRYGELESPQSTSERVEGIEKVIATHAFQLLSLDLPWRRCEAPDCGVYYKVPMRRVGDSLADHLGHRERASSYCCAACQRRAKRAAKARARRIAGEMVARNIHIYVDADGKGADRVTLARQALLREANSRAAKEGGVKKMVSDGTRPSDPRDAVPALLTMADVDKIVEKAAAKAGLA